MFAMIETGNSLQVHVMMQGLKMATRILGQEPAVAGCIFGVGNDGL